MNVGVVPARGGSSLRRKNLQNVDGLPLVIRAARTLTDAGCDPVVVTTDDDEIEAVAQAHGYATHRRDPVPDIQPVTYAASPWRLHDVVMLQPTCPHVTVDTIRHITAEAQQHGAVVAGVPETHLMWANGHPVRPRVNRQQQAGLLREVGLYGWSEGKAGDPPVRCVPIPAVEGTDIDTARQLWDAQLAARPVTFHVLGNRTAGSGHVRRCLVLAQQLAHHDVRFTIADGSDPWVERLIQTEGWPVVGRWDGVVVHDALDSPAGIFDGRVAVTLEDQGPGAAGAVSINAMYGSGNHVGGRWAVLDPTFSGWPAKRETGRVLVTFGGTDPACLTERVAMALQTDPELGGTAGRSVEVVRPPSRPDAPGRPSPSMAADLYRSDVVVCSAGRTLFEAAAVGTPAVVIGQNRREATHMHIGRGNVWLGLHDQVTDGEVVKAVRGMLDDRLLRGRLRERGWIDGRGARRVARLVDQMTERL